MRTRNLWYRVKGFYSVKKLGYLLDMKNIKDAQYRMKILHFFDSYGLDATKEAFGVSRRTLFRWKALLKKKGNHTTSLIPKSCSPKNKRISQVPDIVTKEIRRLREAYPNLGKAKVHVLLQEWCKANNLKCPSESTIGRIIAKAKDKMRLVPYRIDSKGRVKKPKKRDFKNRKPKGLTAKPMNLWATDTIERVCEGMRRYIITFFDPTARIGFAVGLPSKATKWTSKALEALLQGLHVNELESDDSQRTICFLSDNGSEFCKEFDALLQTHNLTHYWTYPRSPKMNAHCERFNRTIQEQFIDWNEDLLFTDLELFNEKLSDWLIQYNTIIPHHSLGLKPPVRWLMENYPECQRLWTNTLCIDASKNML